MRHEILCLPWNINSLTFEMKLIIMNRTHSEYVTSQNLSTTLGFNLNMWTSQNLYHHVDFLESPHTNPPLESYQKTRHNLFLKSKPKIQSNSKEKYMMHTWKCRKSIKQFQIDSTVDTSLTPATLKLTKIFTKMARRELLRKFDPWRPLDFCWVEDLPQPSIFPNSKLYHRSFSSCPWQIVVEDICPYGTMSLISKLSLIVFNISYLSLPFTCKV